MSQFTLHHYDMSPYSEKVRCMLGYADIDWISVKTDEMPPRKLLEPLAGKYKRIPVAQIGADVFCDSRIISEEIARISGKKELSLSQQSAEQLAFIAETEGHVFFACVMSGNSSKVMKKAIKSMGLFGLVRFAIDRVGMARGMPEKFDASAAKPMAKGFIKKCDRMLVDDYLFGTQATLADFCAYHCLWFIRDVGELHTIDKYPKVIAWMDKMKGYSLPAKQELSATQALKLASTNVTRTIDETDKQSELIGKQVNIGPTDYRLINTKGKLVGEDSNRWIIEQQSKAAGTVHTHFPKQGHAINEA